MTSKEQERKALEQIRKIIEGLGENSYVGKAFEGCFEFAEDNINNDFWMSMKERKEAAESAEDKLRLKVGEKIEQIKSLEMKVEALQNVNAKKEDTILAYSKEAEKMVERINGLKESAIKHWNDLQAAKAKLDEKEDEIIRLKAKLYDLMAK